MVGERRLATWSVRGRCWIEVTVGLKPSEIDAYVAALESPNDSKRIDLEVLSYGVAGRSDTKNDPPFFVFAATRSTDSDEIGLALGLMFGGAGFRDIGAGTDLRNYQEETIAGKQVYVGTSDMLDQNEHVRGRPFLYQNDDYMFLVIAEDDDWAADAIGQLP